MSYRKALDISSSGVSQLLEELKKICQGVVKVLVAPYDANAQLTFLATKDTMQVVISDDPNLIPFGCPRIIYDMDKYGNGLEFMSSKFLGSDHRTIYANFTIFTQEVLLEMCVLSGCKYFWKDFDFTEAYSIFNCRDIEETRMRLSESYIPSDFPAFKRAVWAYKHQIVFNPKKQDIEYLSDLGEDRDEILSSEDSSDFLGSEIDKKDIVEIARGNLNIVTRKSSVGEMEKRKRQRSEKDEGTINDDSISSDSGSEGDSEMSSDSERFMYDILSLKRRKNKPLFFE